MAQHDYIISNQTFPNTRADLNNVLQAIATCNKGSSAPTTQYAGQMWIDDSAGTTWTLYLYDGSDNIQVATIDTTANTINFIDSVVSGFDIVTDTTPQLGGDLDTNGNNINFADGNRARFGTGNDLEIYHDGVNSVIKDTGTGNLYLAGSSQINITNSATNQSLARFIEGGASELYHNASKKFETTSTGVDVTGSLDADSSLINTTDTTPSENNDSGGISLRSNGQVNVSVDGGAGLDINRKTSDGQILRLRKDGTDVGSIGSFSSLPYFAGSSDGILIGSGNVVPSTNTGAIADNTVDLGASNRRFEKLYLGSSAVISEATLTDGATISWDVSTSSVAKVTLGGNRTLSAPSNALDEGQFISLLVIQDGTGSRTLTWNAVYEFASDTAPTLTTTGGKGDLFVFRYNGTKWLEVGRNLNLSLS